MFCFRTLSFVWLQKDGMTIRIESRGLWVVYPVFVLNFFSSVNDNARTSAWLDLFEDFSYPIVRCLECDGYKTADQVTVRTLSCSCVLEQHVQWYYAMFTVMDLAVGVCRNMHRRSECVTRCVLKLCVTLCVEVIVVCYALCWSCVLRFVLKLCVTL